MAPTLFVDEMNRQSNEAKSLVRTAETSPGWEKLAETCGSRPSLLGRCFFTNETRKQAPPHLDLLDDDGEFEANNHSK